MPTFVNNNPTAIRVREDGVLRRILAGQTVEADGAFADALERTPGVETAGGDDESAWQERVDANNAAGLSDGPALRAQAKGLIGPMRQSLRAATIAAPLRVVVGDDMAPFGPGSGTVTTKADAASMSPLDRDAFADHEALPGERIEGAGEVPAVGGDISAAADYTEAEVHNAQERNATEAEEAAKAYIEGVPALTAQASGADASSEDSSEEAPAEAPPENPTDDAGLQPPYDQYGLGELREEAGRRGVATGGTKAELVSRLEENDAG